MIEEIKNALRAQDKEVVERKISLKLGKEKYLEFIDFCTNGTKLVDENFDDFKVWVFNKVFISSSGHVHFEHDPLLLDDEYKIENK